MADIGSSNVRILADKLSGATPTDVKRIKAGVIGLARGLRNKIQPPWWDRLDADATIIRAQVDLLDDAIGKLDAAQETEDIKAAILYLAATTEVMSSQYGDRDATNDALARYEQNLLEFGTQVGDVVGNAAGKTLRIAAEMATNAAIQAAKSAANGAMGKGDPNTHWPTTVAILLGLGLVAYLLYRRFR
jgi:hypothetical protein